MKENMNIWNRMKNPPSSALKTIQAGRLRGKSDINPQWRYQQMTEVFGMCSVGWKYTIDNVDFKDGDNGQVVCFVFISLFVKTEEGWSDAIPANGGSMFIANEKNGSFTSDEAVKMATTDALGTAMKMLGLAAEVYLGNADGSKYPTHTPVIPAQEVNSNKVIAALNAASNTKAALTAAWASLTEAERNEPSVRKVATELNAKFKQP